MDGFDPTIVVPKVAVDRYKKRIKQEDIYRGQANYGKAAAAGALAGLVARLKKIQPSHRAAIGAGAGLLAEGIVRVAGSSTKDAYGERSHTAKVSEKLPVAAGVATAGVLAYRRLKRAAREFQSGNQEARKRIEFGSVVKFSIPASLRRKLITAIALSGGITAADAATRATFPGDDDRKKAAVKGLKEGALYGGVLAGTEPLLGSSLRRIARHFAARRKLTEFRALPIGKDADATDLARQRRKLALYAGGALAGAGALAILARSGSGAGRAVSPSIKPAGRGTMDRLAAANKLRAERGYVHMKPMMPGQRKRFDKLPAQTQVNTGKVARLAIHPQLSGGERQKMRQWLGRIRTSHKFSKAEGRIKKEEIQFSSFVKDMKFKELPARARADIRAFHPAMKSNTRLAHYGMTTKELTPKADPHNLAAARKNVGKTSRKVCADEVYQQRGKKFVLVNNDQIVDGHHYVAKAERGRVTASLHVIDLTPARFQTTLERKLRNAVEFADTVNGSTPQKDLPGWVQIRRGNAVKRQKRGERLRTAADVAGIAGGTAAVADAIHRAVSRKEAVGSLKGYLKKVGLERKAEGRSKKEEVFFRRREQLREGGKTEAEKGSGRFVDPIAVSAGLKPAYAITAGGDRRFYGGSHGGDLAITHAQVLRSAYTHGGAIRKYAHRTGNLLRDTTDVAVGNPRRTDAYGRPQRREWEKPWFGRAVKDAAIGATILGGALALKKSPKLRGRVMNAGAEIRRKVNKMVPDLLADWGPRVRLTSFASVPFKFGGKIDYKRQDQLYTIAKRLRRIVRRNSGLPIRPPIAGSIQAKPSSVVRGFSGRTRTRTITGFDDIANYAGWDVRDPRGRSARVFAPGSRKRMRREKDWHERIDVQRKLLGALALVGTVGAGAAGIAIGRRHPMKPRLPIKSKTIVPVKFA